MRIVSLLPAATEWVAAFGGVDELVGRSHECDAPASVRKLPVLTRARFGEAEGSAAIDRAVQEQRRQNLSLYQVDAEALRALRPDLILTQAQCEVCAVSPQQLEEALSGWAGTPPQILSVAPTTLKQVLDAALRIGQAIGRGAAAMRFIAEKEKRLHQLRERLGLRRRATGSEGLLTLACIEWMEPLMTAGHWMPDVAEMAGARAVLAEADAASQPISWTALRRANPDALALMPCGFTVEETIRDLCCLTERPGWGDLRAVQAGRVYLFDGNAYFNRPGPRLYRAIELLAAALHPERAALKKEAAPWEVQPLHRAVPTGASAG